MCYYKCFICYYCKKKLNRTLTTKCINKECFKIHVHNVKTLCLYCKQKDPSMLQEKFKTKPWIKYETISLKSGHRNFWCE